MKIVCMSDTHTKHRQFTVPDGDVFVHAGDFTNRGELEDICSFDRWLGELPHKHKIVIAGNHDISFQRTPELARQWLTNATYLEDSHIVIDGVKFYGTPWSPDFFPEHWAFNQNSQKAGERWRKIPKDTDVLIVHGPPYKACDWVPRRTMGEHVEVEHVGCKALRNRIKQLNLKAVICGHIHEAYGVEMVKDTPVYNVASLDGRYRVGNKPVEVVI